jgi:hypothetical protein
MDTVAAEKKARSDAEIPRLSKSLRSVAASVDLPEIPNRAIVRPRPIADLPVSYMLIALRLQFSRAASSPWLKFNLLRIDRTARPILPIGLWYFWSR